MANDNVAGEVETSDDWGSVIFNALLSINGAEYVNVLKQTPTKRSNSTQATSHSCPHENKFQDAF